MECRIEYNIDGTRGHVVIEAKHGIDALLAWLETIPQSAAVKAIVRVIKPAEVVQ